MGDESMSKAEVRKWLDVVPSQLRIFAPVIPMLRKFRVRPVFEIYELQNLLHARVLLPIVVFAFRLL